MAKYKLKDGEGIIPKGTTVITDGAFKDCTGLTSIVIPDSMTSIGEEAFKDCTNLKIIKVPQKREINS